MLPLKEASLAAKLAVVDEWEDADADVAVPTVVVVIDALADGLVKVPLA
jgi:hypothetical protein